MEYLPVQQFGFTAVRHEWSRPDGMVVAVFGNLLEVRVDLSECEYGLEWLEDRSLSDDGVTGCPEAEQEAREEKCVESVRVLGVDGAYVSGQGENRPMLVAVDLGAGKPVAVGYVDEHDP